jgi:esterase/lipase
MNNKTTFIDTKQTDPTKYAERPRKSNWKIEALKKGLQVFQHVSPSLASRVIWHHFTKPAKPRFTDQQKALMAQAEISKMNYRGNEITTYKWGTEGPKVLLVHGWSSKTADFRRIIEAFVEKGYVVEGIDMKAHGASDGKHTALPEFRDILKEYYVKNAPYHAVIGYSMGGAATGIMLSELSPALHPKKIFFIATPPFVKYYFKTAVDEAGCNEKTYEELCNMVEKEYNQSIAYFDLTIKAVELKHNDMHFIYDETDNMVPFEHGKKLRALFPNSHLLHTKGIGHYRIIAQKEVVEYLLSHQ